MVSSRTKRFLSIVAFAASIAYLLRLLDMGELREALGTARWHYLGLALSIAFLTVLLSALRWYLLLREVQEADFTKTLKAYLSGYYFIAILPPSVGHAAKVKLVGGDYFRALSSLAMSVVVELVLALSAALIILGLTREGILLLLLLLAALVYERGFYTLADSLLALLERSKVGIFTRLRDYLDRLHRGWRSAKENKRAFSLSFLLAGATFLIQTMGIVLVGAAFGMEVSLPAALKGLLLSMLFASISGIPSGFGANELGIVLGIGASTKATLVAFTYKFLFQYVWAIVGAVVFYTFVGGGSNEGGAR
ncbi:lysylphosphatidylglycerol synthase transmembrane domain-containing protein [Palaeococcus ferrophilus]|uniref:lysylphosphatidylglycerol synthase transmembrane domain-containing protein n=1 Tax=Palaeococcus ferrophilus TaxID=83868 RepID=UPI00064F4208|nr:lysylphosphatidylglycerol synthase transmembrane domain-containing protein [Palaeococcus ferrophilus]